MHLAGLPKDYISTAVAKAASLGSETTVYAACEALGVLRAAKTWNLFGASELSSRLDAVCDLVDEAVSLAGLEHAISAYTGLMRTRLSDGADFWRQQGSTAAKAARLAEALKQLKRPDVSADGRAEADQKIAEIAAKMVAARATATAPELLRNCALTSCGAKEAHVLHFSKCGVCKAVVYCSKACQAADWPIHKANCEALKTAAMTPPQPCAAAA
jgi:hypothetical protein